MDVVIAVGNVFRRDDGVAAVIAESLRSRALAGVEVIDELCEPARLIETWDGARLCVLVDALSTGAEPGTVHRVELDEAADVPFDLHASAHSTHGLAIADAVALGRALGRLPRRLVVVGVEAGDVTEGSGLSARVVRAVPAAVQTVLDEIATGVRHP